MSERLALSPDQSNLYVTLLSQEHVDYLPHGTETRRPSGYLRCEQP